MANDFELELDEMQEIVDDFLVEADELIVSLDNNLVTLESAPDDLDLLNEIFRAAHTVKGTSSFLGFEKITSLTHRMEDILNKLRKSELSVTPTIMDLLLEALDILKSLLENVRENKCEDDRDLTDIINRLLEVFNSKNEEESFQTVDDKKKLPETISVPTVKEDSTENDSTKPTAATVLEKEADKIISSETNLPEKKISEQDNHKRKTIKEQTIRVDVNRLDTLMDMMGELVLGRNSLNQSVKSLNNEHEGEYELQQINHSNNSINFITTELQEAVMKMRMQPVGKVFKKFPRLVRDLSRESKKEIDLEITGETTELDKSVIEEIGDPLVHIIRNSCDHGIESSEERAAKGKPPRGKISLSARQEGSHILIIIKDDGKGFDINAIRAKAVERGLVKKEDIGNLSNREIFNFIFEAGFSTAKKVTDISGRGVGMDVVRTNIEKLKGLVELSSEKDKGTVITIKLPLTLAILQGLLIESDNEVFILPLTSVYETVNTEHSEVYYINRKPVIRLRDEIIPIINLNEILKKSSAGFKIVKKPYIVIIGLVDKKLGIIIDRFLGQEEVVIKSLSNYLGNLEGIAGATILGDGRIRLIIDLIGLFNIAKNICK
ncbi:MAG: chemotaxis protein CheA [Candidatus Zixiibacteriota bacterium]